MKRLKRRLSALLLTLTLIASMSVVQQLTAEAEGMPPESIEECESNFGTDFKITFPASAFDWLSG